MGLIDEFVRSLLHGEIVRWLLRIYLQLMVMLDGILEDLIQIVPRSAQLLLQQIGPTFL